MDQPVPAPGGPVVVGAVHDSVDAMVRLGSFMEQLGDSGGLRIHMSPLLRQHAFMVQRAAVYGRSLDVGPQL